MSETSKYPKWVNGLLAVACIISLPAIAPIAMYSYSEYKLKMKYEVMFAEIDMADWGSLNRLCVNFTDIAIKQNWRDVAERWSDLCLRHNKEFLEKYAGQ